MLLDIWMPEMDGLETLKRVRDLMPKLLVVMMSGHGSIETAVKAIRLGAYDYIEKPLSLENVTLRIRHALDQQRLEEENQDAPDQGRSGDSNWSATSPAMQQSPAIDCDGRPHKRPRVDWRGKRHREGTGRTRDPSASPRPRSSICRSELRGHS